MANANYIKEFLVSLGYKVDENGQRKFDDALGKSDKSTESFAKNLKAAAVAMTTLATVAAYRLNTLAINSERVGASAANIDSFRQSVSDLGGDANAAMSSVAGLTEKIRNNPVGMGNAFSRFGVEIKDANGNVRDTIDLLRELAQASDFKALSYEQQAAYMRDVFGVDGLTARTIMKPEFLASMQKYLDVQKKLGGSIDQSAASTRKLTAQFGEMKFKAGAALDVVVGNLADKLNPVMDQANKKLDEMLDWYSKLSPEAQEAAKNIGSVAVSISALVTGLTALKVAKGILGGLFGGGAAAGGAAGGAAASGSFLANPLAWLGIAAVGSAGANASMVLKDSDWQVNAENGGDLVGALYGNGRESKKHATVTQGLETVSKDLFPREKNEAEASTPRKGKISRGDRNNNGGNLDHSKMSAQQAARREGGAKGRFAVFDTPELGLRALAVQLKRYANAGENTVYKIISKYAPAKENNTTAYMHSVSKNLNVGIHDKLNLCNPELLKKLMTAVIKHENGYNPYSQQKIADAAIFGTQHRGKWGSRWEGANLNQNVNITINESNNSRETAESIKNSIKDANGLLIRNFNNPAN